MQHYDQYSGAVLFNPYLPRLFHTLNLLNADGRFLSIEHAWIAQACLYYAVSGETFEDQTNSMLCRYLCGVHEEELPEGPIVLSPQALETTHQMLEAVVANWNAGRLSIDGLRETFLRREGMFTCTNQGATLLVNRKGVDVLVDMLPWSYRQVFHTWMSGALEVSW